MRLPLLVLPFVLIAACDAYDPSLLQPDVGMNLPDAGGDADDNDGGDDECRVVPDSDCEIVCIERCNGLDDDCNGVIDDNAAWSCGLANAEAACIAGECELVACQGAFADCNGEESDGCEASLDTDPLTCGLCGAQCSYLNSSARCEQGTCVPGDCDDGFGDCDGNPGNGCETSVRSLDNCGECGGDCVVGDNALPGCDEGICTIAQCVGNFGNCDGDIDNGCETPLNDADNCGECGRNCDALPNAMAMCGATGCEQVVCIGDYRDCDGLANTGCEAPLEDPRNCGACGMACDLPNVAVHLCTVMGQNAACGIDHSAPNDGCDPGFADCNDEDDDGCEVPLNTLTDCGSCAMACSMLPAALASCESGTCEFVDCASGYDDCGENGSCENLSNDADNCGTCGTKCPGSAPNCSGGRCRVDSCPSGMGDCDDNPSDCEAALNTATHCGTCGVTCPATVTYGTASFVCLTCQITCNANFANCDGNPNNGCETDLRAVSTCGACGTACSSPNATAVCSSGSCGLGMCNSGFGNCDNMAGNGCEAALNTPNNCGSCNNDCTGRPNTTGAGCTGGTCSFTCMGSFRDCDGMPGNGCEVSITSTQHCGACNNNCANLDNVADATCNGTSCVITTCDAGYADCDGLPGNGCERSINTMTDCGGCNMACGRANASATCNAGVCTLGACNMGFGNCDGMAGNGCETQLNTTAHCGTCTTTCGSGQVCNGGMCGQVNCPSGFSLCGGSTCIDIRGSCPPWPGCLNGKPGDNNCGACGYRCPLYGGDHCCL